VGADHSGSVIVQAQLLANDVEVAWSIDADPNAVGTDTDDCDLDVAADQNPLARFARQHKHGFTPFLGRSCMGMSCTENAAGFRTLSHLVPAHASKCRHCDDVIAKSTVQPAENCRPDDDFLRLSRW
jgi:hypothetical protein